MLEVFFIVVVLTSHGFDFAVVERSRNHHPHRCLSEVEGSEDEGRGGKSNGSEGCRDDAKGNS
jgi:hypothetical protein